MKHLLINLILITTLLMCDIPSINDSKWNNIQTNSIKIDYLWKNKLPWCKAIITLNYSQEDILKEIRNISNYEKIFDTVISSKEYENNIVHIILDLPGVFSNRDYIVSFNYINEFEKNKTIIYEFSSVDDFIEINYDYVRLINAGGQWRLKSINDNITEVTYIWNGDMSGNFPSWGLKRAWLKQGNEVLKNLKTALVENGES